MVTARRARLTGMAMLIMTFVAGALAGAATMQVLGADEAPKLRRASSQTSPDLLDVLNLTTEQRMQVDAILERRRAQMEAFWDEHRPALRSIADSARVELRSVLTMEQQATEERFVEERREQSKKHDRRSDKW
jgi:hypothetical protein